jgi:hypothetical protein
MSDVGPCQRRVAGRVSARQLDTFNQDDWTETLRGSEHLRRRDSFKPPDRPPLG